MLRKMFLGLAILLIAIYFVGYFLPDTAHVERSLTLNAPICTIYAQLDDLERYPAWYPFAQVDPNIHFEFTGPRRGLGAQMSWSSDHDNIGRGSQEITGTEPYSHLSYRLSFEGHGETDGLFRLAEIADGTSVVWSIDRELKGPIERYYGMSRLDFMVGREFEKGLDQLKVVVEALPSTPWCEASIETLEVEGITAALLQGRAPSDLDSVQEAFFTGLDNLSAHMDDQGWIASASPFAIIQDRTEHEVVYELGFPLAFKPEPSTWEGGITVRDIPSRSVLRLRHEGPPEALLHTHEMLMAFGQARGFHFGGSPWIEFADPSFHQEQKVWIYQPIRRKQ